jgi:hypothetical protein
MIRTSDTKAAKSAPVPVDEADEKRKDKSQDRRDEARVAQTRRASLYSDSDHKSDEAEGNVDEVGCTYREAGPFPRPGRKKDPIRQSKAPGDCGTG